MSKLFLFGLVAAVLVISTSAQVLKSCIGTYQTTDPNGAADLPGAKGTRCTPITNVPAGNCVAGATAQTANAKCQYSYLAGYYVCCYDRVATTFITPGPGSTFATLGPGTTPTPQFEKPKCPNGALSSIVAGSSYPQTCNITNLKNQACPSPSTQTCTLAANVVDVYNTASISDDLGAGKTPYICCLTNSLKLYANVFIDTGLTGTTTSVVPTAPLYGIDSVSLGGTPINMIGLNDDLSYVPNQLATQPLTVTLYSPTVATLFYHVLMFDASTNKDCWFVANNAGTGTTAITVSALALTSGASVVNTGTAAAPVYALSSTYVAPRYTVTRRYVVLVWQTTTRLTFAAANTASTTLINPNPGLYGDFEPGRLAGAQGSFTTVSALIKGKFVAAGLTTPWAGTFFYLKN